MWLQFWQEQGVSDWIELEGSRIGEMGIGWYAMTIEAPADWKARDLYMWFVSDEEAHVWRNGKLIRHRDQGSAGWSTPTLAVMRQALIPGAKNVIVVRVYNESQAGGMWRAVRVVEPKKN